MSKVVTNERMKTTLVEKNLLHSWCLPVRFVICDILSIVAPRVGHQVRFQERQFLNHNSCSPLSSG